MAGTGAVGVVGAAGVGGGAVGLVGAAGVGGATLEAFEVCGLDGPRGTPFEQPIAKARSVHSGRHKNLDVMSFLLELRNLERHAKAR